ncbi:MAG: single-stranded-DNA-specific exonuclease RecJ [Oscillospiraceae bacterium]
MKYKQWNICTPRTEDCQAMVSAGIPPLPAAVLCARGLDTPEKARAFLDDREELLHNPFLLKDMDRAVARIKQALKQHEIIAVYGDYDVDGITSTCLLTDYLCRQGATVIPYIPDRMGEGYGLSDQAVELLHEQGVTLIVTVDCGITAAHETLRAAELGMDVVITDHHECKETLPAAVAVVNPHRMDCRYPFPCLAGVGVAFKLVLALGGEENRQTLLAEYADLTAIGTVADVMQLTGENRAIVRLGLKALAHTRRPGLRSLIREAGAEGKPLTATTIGYTLAPRINASGRMGCAALAAELLLTQDPVRAEALARELCALNRERQAIEGEIFEECVARLDREGGSHAVIVLASEGWHQGVVGIVASRLAEKYSCPAFMICLQDGKGKGSCRSFGGFNLFAALEQCAGLLEDFGGHELAAGFTISEENIPAFRARMEAAVLERTGGAEMVSTLQIDAQISDPALLSQEGVEALSLLEPFGAGNPKPVFMLSGAVILSMFEVGNGRHLKLRLRCQGAVFDAIFFSASAGQLGLGPGDRVDAAFTPQINEFRGVRSVQLQICDLHNALTRAQAERSLFERLCSGAPLSAVEAQAITPTREEFETVWRYLKRYASPAPLEDHPTHLAKNIAKTFHTREAYARTMVCIRVFDERGLIQVEHQTAGRLRIGLCRVDSKVDLEESELLRRLRRLTQS